MASKHGEVNNFLCSAEADIPLVSLVFISAFLKDSDCQV